MKKIGLTFEQEFELLKMKTEIQNCTNIEAVRNLALQVIKTSMVQNNIFKDLLKGED